MEQESNKSNWKKWWEDLAMRVDKALMEGRFTEFYQLGKQVKLKVFSALYEPGLTGWTEV